LAVGNHLWCVFIGYSLSQQVSFELIVCPPLDPDQCYVCGNQIQGIVWSNKPSRELSWKHCLGSEGCKRPQTHPLPMPVCIWTHFHLVSSDPGTRRSWLTYSWTLTLLNSWNQYLTCHLAFFFSFYTS